MADYNSISTCTYVLSCVYKHILPDEFNHLYRGHKSLVAKKLGLPFQRTRAKKKHILPTYEVLVQLIMSATPANKQRESSLDV